MIECRDSLEYMKEIEQYGLDLVYCDPPYALGSSVGIRKDGKVDYVKGVDFMNKWSMPDGSYWEKWFIEAYRTLKHGGYLIMFGMDRQLLLFKYYACLAGFVEQQSLYWYFISNFPKATDLSKMIDKNLGLEREVVGHQEMGGTARKVKGKNGHGGKTSGANQEYDETTIDITKPNSDLAKKYEGYKYSISPLKQTNETIMVFQKPCKTGSPLHDTLAYENGDKTISVSALNIDGNRVGTEKRDQFSGKGTNGDVYLEYPQENAHWETVEGRYPAQTFIDSKVAERLDLQSGVSKSSASDYNLELSDNQDNVVKINNNFKSGIHFDDIGGCSKILHKCDYTDEDYDLYNYEPKVSSSERQSGFDSYLTLKYNISMEVFQLCQDENMEVDQLLKKVISEIAITHLDIEKCGESITVLCHQDFLSITKTEISKITELKILNSLMHLLTKDYTQNVSCEMESGGRNVQNVENTKSATQIIGIGQTQENGLLIRGVANAIYTMLLSLNERENWQVRQNNHVTLKPIALNEKILKLFKTPNDQRICYAFAGAGSEIIGGIKAGFDNWCGCEISQEYVDIANARIKYWKEEMTTQTSIFDFLD